MQKLDRATDLLWKLTGHPSTPRDLLARLERLESRVALISLGVYNTQRAAAGKASSGSKADENRLCSADQQAAKAVANYDAGDMHKAANKVLVALRKFSEPG